MSADRAKLSASTVRTSTAMAVKIGARGWPIPLAGETPFDSVRTGNVVSAAATGWGSSARLMVMIRSGRR